LNNRGKNHLTLVETTAKKGHITQNANREQAFQIILKENI